MKTLMKTAAAAAAAVAAVAVSTSGSAQAHVGHHESSAFGLYASAHNINVGPLGTSHYPEGPAQGSIIDTEHDLVIAGLASSKSGGDHYTGESWASATVAKVGIDLFKLHPTIPLPAGVLGLTVDAVSSSCKATNTGITGSAELGGVTLTVLGQKVWVPLNAPKNFHVNVLGLVDVWVNKQTTDEHGNLQVTALDIESTKLFETIAFGNLDVALATVNCGPTGDFTVPGDPLWHDGHDGGSTSGTHDS